jgi:hypothetical protein
LKRPPIEEGGMEFPEPAFRKFHAQSDSILMRISSDKRPLERQKRYAGIA